MTNAPQTITANAPRPSLCERIDQAQAAGMAPDAARAFARTGESIAAANPAAQRERLVAPRITLSQARTLAAFDSLQAYLSEVTRADGTLVLRASLSYDDAQCNGVASYDVTIDGGLYVVDLDGTEAFFPRETMRAVLREELS